MIIIIVVVIIIIIITNYYFLIVVISLKFVFQHIALKFSILRKSWPKSMCDKWQTNVNYLPCIIG